MESLLQEKPDEQKARLLIGRTLYRERKFEEADKYFEEILHPDSGRPTSNGLRASATAYRILSLHSREERKLARRVYEDTAPYFRESNLKNLWLTEEDRSKLLEAISTYQGARQVIPEGILSDIVLFGEKDSLEVEIVCDPFLTHKVFEIMEPSPERIVVDLSGLKKIESNRSISVNDFGIQTIRTGMYKTDIARVVFDALDRLPTYRVEKSPMGLRIVIERPFSQLP